jgi:hypothetical protein
MMILRARWLLPALVLALASGECAAQRDWSKASRLRLNLHIFGLSYHPDRAGTRLNDLDNEVNLGLGLNYRLHEDDHGIAAVESGLYYDSGRQWAKFAGLGYQLKIGERWALGADLVGVQSKTYNGGDPFIAAIPHLTYDFGRVQLNAIYIPHVRNYNLFAVFGFYLTVPFQY